MRNQLSECVSTWDVFCWLQNAMQDEPLTADFQRELITAEPIIRTKIDHHIIAALQGFATYPSTFYQNMYIYLKLNLAEQKELKNYTERVGMLYMDQLNKELESRHTYSLIDHNGMVQDQIIF